MLYKYYTLFVGIDSKIDELGQRIDQLEYMMNVSHQNVMPTDEPAQYVHFPLATATDLDKFAKLMKTGKIDEPSVSAKFDQVSSIVHTEQSQFTVPLRDG